MYDGAMPKPKSKDRARHARRNRAEGWDSVLKDVPLKSIIWAGQYMPDGTITTFYPKPESVATMAMYDSLPPAFRQAIANAPYAFPTAALHNKRHLDHVIAEKLAERDKTKIGPVPIDYTPKKKRRRRV